MERRVMEMNIMVWNADGVYKQRGEFRQYLQEEAVDVCLMCETHLKPGVAVKVPNYACYRNDRATAMGGTAIYVKKTLQHHETPLPPLQSLEATAVTVNTRNGKITFIAAYRRPTRAPVHAADIETLLSLPGKIFIGGDFNAKNVAWNSRLTNNNGRRLQRVAARCEAIIIGPYEPTIHPKNGGMPDVLDMALVKGIRHGITAETKIALGSDHLPVHFALITEATKQPRRGLNIKGIRWEQFKEKLAEDFRHLEVGDDTEEAVAAFTNATLAAAAEATPPEDASERLTVKGRLPRALRDKIAEKNRLRRNWQITRDPATKRDINRMCREIKAEAEHHRLQSWAGKVASLKIEDGTAWRTTKMFTRRFRRTPPLQTGHGTVAEPNEKAEALAAIFEENFTPIEHDTDQEHTNVVLTRLPLFLTAEDPEEQPIQPVSTEEVQRNLRWLHPGKAGGTDLITNRILRELPEEAAAYLADIFTAILRTGKFPARWKHAEIVAIPKAGKDPRLPSSYRPISLLPAVSKVFERIYITRLTQHVDEERLLPEEQCGFRRGHATTHQLLKLTEEAMDALERREYFGAILLDVTRAFDSVWHEGLIYKLLTSGIPLPHVRLLHSYLAGRTFHVRIDNGKSSRKTIKAGVPQGSVLGPLLYILYTADLPTVPRVQLLLYADDTALSSRSMRAATLQRRLQEACDAIVEWARKWRLAYNGAKSQCLIISRREVPIALPQIQIRGTAVRWSNAARYLGVTFDKRMTWRQHIEELRGKALGRLRELYPLLNPETTLPTRLGITVYQALIRPLLEYAAVVWGNAAATHTSRLQRIQNKALRLALHLPRDTSEEAIHQMAEIPRLKDRWKTLARKFYKSARTSNNRIIRSLGQKIHRRHTTRWPDLLLRED